MKQHGFRLATRITIGAIAIVVLCAVAWMLIEEARLRDVYKSELRAALNRGYDARDGDTLERREARLQQILPGK